MSGGRTASPNVSRTSLLARVGPQSLGSRFSKTFADSQEKPLHAKLYIYIYIHACIKRAKK